MNTGHSQELHLDTGDALLVVDVQNDFLPGGKLAVPNGEEILSVLNGYLNLFQRNQLPVFATRDWHPHNHCSFKDQGGPWPPHCVQDSEGAKFAAGLSFPASTDIVSKANRPDADAYSGFQGTDLDQRLRKSGIRRLFIGGLATDYCVLNTVKDARGCGYTVILLDDAIRAVNVDPQNGDKAREEMIRLGAHPVTLDHITVTVSQPGTLLTDYYQLTMLKSYFDQAMQETAVFEFFVRDLPQDRDFLMAAGLEQVLEFLENLRFTAQELDWLERFAKFPRKFLNHLAAIKFTGDVHAMREGTVFFGQEPILRITAPLPQAQLVETRVINLLQYQTLVASKAARMVLAAPRKSMIDFGLRRAHGAEAGLLASRASYIAGFTGTAHVLAAALFDLPLFGTMAHSLIQAHEDETTAFEHFARSHPDNVVLLLDTYDTLAAAKKLIPLAKRLRQSNLTIHGVRLDSGDLVKNSFKVRRILDDGDLQDVKIFVSGNLDEYALKKLTDEAAPVDGFGIGTRLTTSADVSYLDCVYKLQEYAGKPRRKRSEGKATWPGRKQVFRKKGDDGLWSGDLLTLESETGEGEPLLQAVMRSGRRVGPPASLVDLRQRAATELKICSESLKKLALDKPFPVTISRILRELARSVDEFHTPLE